VYDWKLLIKKANGYQNMERDISLFEKFEKGEILSTLSIVFRLDTHKKSTKNLILLNVKRSDGIL